MLSYPIRCKDCNALLVLDIKATVKDYMLFSGATNDNVENIIESIINNTLIYKCSGCGQLYKYTYKEVEKEVREYIKKDLPLFVMREDMLSDLFEIKHSFFIYCGKCPGFDGSGCCPKELIKSCPVKRFPINEL